MAITSITTSGCTLNLTTAPGGSGITFDWAVSVFP
jgi:hypothetical protein